MTEKSGTYHWYMFAYLFLHEIENFICNRLGKGFLTVNSRIKIADAVCTTVAAWEAQAVFNVWQPSWERLPGIEVTQEIMREMTQVYDEIKMNNN